MALLVPAVKLGPSQVDKGGAAAKKGVVQGVSKIGTGGRMCSSMIASRVLFDKLARSAPATTRTCTCLPSTHLQKDIMTTFEWSKGCLPKSERQHYGPSGMSCAAQFILAVMIKLFKNVHCLSTVKWLDRCQMQQQQQSGARQLMANSNIQVFQCSGKAGRKMVSP